MDAEIGTTIRDGISIYSLSYRPTETTGEPDQFHSIHVTVDRPGLKVITRKGYYQEQRPYLATRRVRRDC